MTLLAQQVKDAKALAAIVKVMRERGAPHDEMLSEIQDFLSIAGYDVPLRSYQGTTAEEHKAWFNTVACIEDVWNSHRDPAAAEYQECEKAPCTWCEQAAVALAWLRGSDGFRRNTGVPAVPGPLRVPSVSPGDLEVHAVECSICRQRHGPEKRHACE